MKHQTFSYTGDSLFYFVDEPRGLAIVVNRANLYEGEMRRREWHGRVRRIKFSERLTGTEMYHVE